MNRKFIAVVALILVGVMVLSACQPAAPKTATTPATATTPGTTPATSTNVRERVTFDATKSYVYKDSVSLLASNWNPHTYQTNDDSYPTEFLRVGLYGFVFNDELHPSKVEGVDEYAGYAIIPEMAAAMPVDVTKDIKALDNNKFGIPESAESGYAYRIALNKNAKWEDGTAINADTYVYSLKKLLDPALLNYRATDYYSQDLAIAGAEAYARQGQNKWTFNALGMSVDAFLADGGKVEDLIIDLNGFWGITTAEGDNYAYVTNDTLIRDPAVDEGEDEDYVSAKYLYENYLAPGAVYAAYAEEYLGTGSCEKWGETSWESVGIIKDSEYEFTLVLSRSLSGFYLLYNLSSNWIVKEDLYESCLKQDANGVWSSTYNTSVETTSSYGPYKLTEYKLDQSMTFERNDNWYGYTDGEHEYVDPEDGKIYPMYQTTKVTCLVVPEAATRKEMFLKGQLMGYGLQSEDFEQYRSSDRTYFTPDETIYFFIFNGYLSAIQDREASEGFDKATTDIETITLQSFRKAIAVTYDKEALCAAVSPARSGGYGLIGNNYIYDPDAGLKYRDSDQAKKALCQFYSVDVSKYASLDEAVDSITGYAPETAKALFTEAFNEALEKGYITSADGKTSDQMIKIEYASSATSAFITKTLTYLNEKLAEVLVGTPFEGKIEFYESAPLGNNWSENIRKGSSDTVLAGWSGSALNPYSLSDLYVNPARAYDAKWFDATTVSSTMTINGKELTMTLKEWSDALNGVAVTVDGTEYNFGDGFIDVETRLDILAMIEVTVLNTYDYIPMLQNAGASLLTRQVYYVVDEYSSVMGRGGIAYMKYNYDEAEWNAFVTEQGGQVKY